VREDATKEICISAGGSKLAVGNITERADYTSQTVAAAQVIQAELQKNNIDSLA